MPNTTNNPRFIPDKPAGRTALKATRKSSWRIVCATM